MKNLWLLVNVIGKAAIEHILFAMGIPATITRGHPPNIPRHILIPWVFFFVVFVFLGLWPAAASRDETLFYHQQMVKPVIWPQAKEMIRN